MLPGCFQLHSLVTGRVFSSTKKDKRDDDDDDEDDNEEKKKKPADINKEEMMATAPPRPTNLSPPGHLPPSYSNLELDEMV